MNHFYWKAFLTCSYTVLTHADHQVCSPLKVKYTVPVLGEVSLCHYLFICQFIYIYLAMKILTVQIIFPFFLFLQRKGYDNSLYVM